MSQLAATTEDTLAQPDQARPEAERGWTGPDIYRLDYEGADLKMLATSPGEHHHRLYACTKEPWTVKWIESMAPGEVLYDVGASTGPYSLIAASRGVRTFAFEPGYASYPRLLENTALNRLSRLLTALPIALSSRTGLGLLNYASHLAGGSGHTFWTLGEPADMVRYRPVLQQYVLSFRLDDLAGYDPIIAPPSHIKLDVDGAEEAVLDGMRATVAGPAFRSLMMEMECPCEAALLAKAESLGLELAERFTAAESSWHQEGHHRDDIAYGLFRRRR